MKKEQLPEESRIDSTVRLLIVEDDGDQAEALGSALTLKFPRWKTRRADTLESALALLAEEPFDVAIVDLGLPDTKQDEAPLKIKQKHPDLPIVVLTGQSDTVIAKALISAGIQDFVVKGQVSLGFLAFTVLSARERQARIRDLERAAERDPLTGALNRRALSQALADEISNSGALDKAFGVVYLDLDDFKAINDTHGHAAGDRALLMFVDWLRSESRPSDRIFRIGGDEFVVLVTDIPNRQGLHVYRSRLAERFSQARTLSGSRFAAGISIGSAMFPDDGSTVRALLAAADRRMYRNKALKRADASAPIVLVRGATQAD